MLEYGRIHDDGHAFERGYLGFGQLLDQCSGYIFFDIRVNDATESPSMGDPMLGVGG